MLAARSPRVFCTEYPLALNIVSNVLLANSINIHIVKLDSDEQFFFLNFDLKLRITILTAKINVTDFSNFANIWLIIMSLFLAN